MHDVAKSFGLQSFDVEDNPKEIWGCFSKELIYKPCLFNVRTNRLFWHAGAGIDDPNTFDRQKQYISKYGRKIVNEADIEAKKVWKKCLKLV